MLRVAVIAAAAAFTIPPGFTLSPQLSKPASFVAGKSASVYCAATMADYTAADHAATGQPGVGAAYTIVGTSQSFLSTWVCSYLNRWLAKKPVTSYHLAAAVLALVHEAELEKGVRDESVADCAALALMPRLVAKFFPLRGVYTIHGLMRDAWDAHDGQPAVYLTNCPKR